MERTGNITCDKAIKLARIFETDLNSLILGLEQTVPIPPQKEKEKEINCTIEDKIILTPNETSIITVLRNFSKQDREECIEFIEKKYHNNL